MAVRTGSEALCNGRTRASHRLPTTDARSMLCTPVRQLAKRLQIARALYERGDVYAARKIARMILASPAYDERSGAQDLIDRTAFPIIAYYYAGGVMLLMLGMAALAYLRY